VKRKESSHYAEKRKKHAGHQTCQLKLKKNAQTTNKVKTLTQKPLTWTRYVSNTSFMPIQPNALYDLALTAEHAVPRKEHPKGV
jgi:hypothetical protein